MKKFLVLFLAPVSVLEDWMKTDPIERKSMEDKMSGEWRAWMENNKASLVDAPAGAGQTKSVASGGVTDTKNDVMMYCIVQANSHDEASALFVGHPHLQITQATIEVMAINPLSGLGQ